MFTKGQAIEFLEKCFGEAVLSNGGLNASVLCPICHERSGEETKKKLVIRTDNWMGHCWLCNSKFRSIFFLIKKYKPHFLNEYLEKFDGGSYLVDSDIQSFNDTFEEAEKLILPNGFYLLADQIENSGAHWYTRKAVNYLLNRGLNYNDFWYFKFGITQSDNHYYNRIIIPSFNNEGELNYFTSRTFTKTLKPKYKNPNIHREKIIFNEINIDWTKELTVVEGVFDLTKVNDNATCLLGKELTTDYKLFQMIAIHRTPVVLALDPDAAYFAVNIAKILLEYGVQVKIYQYPKGVKDPGEMTKKEFVDNIQNSKIITEDDLLKYKISLL